MPATKISDVIQPELFTQYTIERTAELSRLVESGIITANPLLNDLITGGGTTLTMPRWNDLTGQSQVLTDSEDIAVSNITTSSDIATLLIRANAWGTHELAGALAGSDPMQAIGDLVAKWWVRDEQRTLMSILKGVFSSATMAALAADYSTEPISASVVLDAKQLLGDAAESLTAMAVHSATYTDLQKKNLIEFVPDSRGEVRIPTYLGYRLIIDDGMPVEGDVYTTYLFSSGVIARGEGVPVSITPVETSRNALGSTDYLIHRRAFVLHPMGIKWKGTPAKPTPSNTELATGTNWERVNETKKIGMVKLTHILTV